MVNTTHKCPFCLYSFYRSSAIPEVINEDITVYRCPNQKEDTSGRKFCGKVLPLNFFDAESLVISIAGSRYVGKTYYLIALLIQLKKNKHFQKLGFSGKLVGDEVAITDILKKIEAFENNNVIDPTHPLEGAHEKALIIDLSIKKGKVSRHIYLSFFDTPGEAYTDIKFMYENFQCLYKADGLLFLIEPMQIKYLRNDIYEANPYLKTQNPEDLHEVFYNVIELLKYVQRNRKPIRPPQSQKSKTEESEADSVEGPSIDNTSNPVDDTIDETIYVTEESNQSFWRKLFGKPSIRTILHEKIRCPIAVGITKVDQIKQLMFNDIPLDYDDFESMYLKGNQINMDLIKDISSEINDLVFQEENGEIGVRNMLETELKYYEFFGIKSGDVNNDGIISNMKQPQGVLLPLIWLLIKLKQF